MEPSLPILNLAEARFDCTFGRGCDGICCREGRPFVYPEEIESLTANLERFLPHMRPEARRAAQKGGFLVPNQRRLGHRVVRVVGGWCLFFHKGCVLHRVGAEEGDPYRYKPSICALFPIQQDDQGRWYVRQKGYKRERWDLFCLDPARTDMPARESLHAEIALAARYDAEQSVAEAANSDPERGHAGSKPLDPGESQH